MIQENQRTILVSADKKKQKNEKKKKRKNQKKREALAAVNKANRPMMRPPCCVCSFVLNSELSESCAPLCACA